MCWNIKVNKGYRFLVSNTGYVIACGKKSTVFKRIILLSSIVFFCLFIGNAIAEITGTAFRDYNADGMQDAFEPGAKGIDVKAYNASGDVADTGLFDTGYLMALVDQHQSGEREHSPVLWSLLMFESFLRQVHDGAPPATASASRRQPEKAGVH